MSRSPLDGSAVAPPWKASGLGRLICAYAGTRHISLPVSGRESLWVTVRSGT